MTTKKHQLIEIEWPSFGLAAPPPRPDLAEFAGRMAAARAGMARLGLTHLVVYGDREHFANLTYLTGFDPRFEEALLILGPAPTPLLVVGNECYGYLASARSMPPGNCAKSCSNPSRCSINHAGAAG